MARPKRLKNSNNLIFWVSSRNLIFFLICRTFQKTRISKNVRISFSWQDLVFEISGLATNSPQNTDFRGETHYHLFSNKKMKKCWTHQKGVWKQFDGGCVSQSHTKVKWWESVCETVCATERQQRKKRNTVGAGVCECKHIGSWIFWIKIPLFFWFFEILKKKNFWTKKIGKIRKND